MTWTIYPQFTLECIRIVVKVNAWDISKHTSDFLDTVPNLQQFSTQKAWFLKIHSFLNMVTENLWLWFFEVLSPRVLKYAFGAKSEKSWKSTWDISWRFLKKLVLSKFKTWIKYVDDFSTIYLKEINIWFFV